ncbi:DUF2784 domain-containing protein [Pseudothauera nasutitermitis]|uniref:DUF2784 domain-containing protein n=1 Tax=Pseudothauera nasutitermitis TaxID=2565930 RepID=A0A4S4ANA6_9RHOO|nr:DUF2784 domain-containing protein [Pseudothauera nasutitermitis]THF61125.1 DUF2784 domain-containing protein [Pseudothauera nasutitermitis]
MQARLIADLLLMLHLAFIVFVVCGGLLALRWPRAAWAHLPAAAWGAVVELGGFICPLTPLEDRYRRLAGQAGIDGGFIEHYLLPLIYPAGLTREIQIGLGLFVVVLNLALYLWAWHRYRRRAARMQ